MDCRIQDYFRVGTLLWMSYPKSDAVESLKKILCDPYFDAVELSHFTLASQREEAAGLLKASAVTAGYGMHPVMLENSLNPNALDEEERAACQKRMLEEVDEAAALGCSGVAFLAGKFDADQIPEHQEQLVKTTLAVCRHAEKKGMSVELEIFDYDFDKAVLIGPAGRAAKFAARIREQCQNFGLLADLSHFPLTYESSSDVFAACAPYLTHFHIGNAVTEPGCEGCGDAHPRFGFPHGANGLEELADFLTILKDCCQARRLTRPILSFEIRPRPYEDPDVVLASSKRFLNRAWALVKP